MLPSFHDEYILGYSVNCVSRRIEVQIGDNAECAGNIRTLIFSGVEGYNFNNDAFGNIILDIEEISVKQLISEYHNEIAESYHMSGAPGPWAVDLIAAPDTLKGVGVRGFVLSSSYGLSGWVLAKEVSVSHAQQGTPADPKTAAQFSVG